MKQYLKELKKMDISDLRFICQELGLKHPLNKRSIIKLLLEPLNKKYRVLSKFEKSDTNINDNRYIPRSDIISQYLEKEDKKSFSLITYDDSQNLRQQYAKQNILDKLSLENFGFFWAAKHGDLNKLQQNIKHGIDLVKHGCKGLHIACEYGRINIIEELLNKGIDINCTYNKYIPSSIAIIHNQFDVIKYLLNNGLDLHRKDNNGQNILLFASWYNRPNMITYFVEQGLSLTESIKNNGDSPLIIASYYGNVDAINMLIDLGVDVNHRNDSGYTALHSTAIVYNDNIASYTGIVDSLINAGAYLNIRNYEGVTPLMLAISHQKLLMITKLLNKKALVYPVTNAYSYPMLQTKLVEWKENNPKIKDLYEVSAFTMFYKKSVNNTSDENDYYVNRYLYSVSSLLITHEFERLLEDFESRDSKQRCVSKFLERYIFHLVRLIDDIEYIQRKLIVEKDRFNETDMFVNLKNIITSSLLQLNTIGKQIHENKTSCYS